MSFYWLKNTIYKWKYVDNIEIGVKATWWGVLMCLTVLELHWVLDQAMPAAERGSWLDLLFLPIDDCYQLQVGGYIIIKAQ